MLTVIFFTKGLGFIKKASNHLIAHEQLHFDLTEFHDINSKREITQLSISKKIRCDGNGTYEHINKVTAVVQKLMI